VFHAAVAGAAVTDQRLYDTYWRERFLGRPQTEPENYERGSLLALAPNLSRPLMLVQGLADDNVFAANTLRLSAALLAAGRPHTVLPLSGVTHMLAQPEVAENLLRLELEFLRGALGLDSPSGLDNPFGLPGADSQPGPPRANSQPGRAAG
jgi:dipeptidyl-peptidase-4